MTFDNDLIINLSSMITLFVINYLKYKADSRVLRKKNEHEHEYLKSEIKSIGKNVNRILENQEFNKLLYDKMTNTAFNIITANSDISASLSMLMNTTLIKIRNFAEKHYDSPYRADKNVIRSYLNIESNTIFKDIDNLANDIFKKKVISGVTYNYSEFIREFTDMEVIVNVMIRRLVENGLTPVEYIDLFNNFVRDILLEQVKGWRKWNNKR